MSTRLIAFLIIIVSLVLDQVTKWMAMAWLKGQPVIHFWNDLLVIQYAENSGGMLGFGGTLPDHWRFVVFTIAVGGISALILYHMIRGKIDSTERYAWALIFSGAIGNLIDRLRFEGHVVDFLNVGIGSLRTGIFNVADMAVMAGLVIFLITAFTGRKHSGPMETDRLN